MEELLKQILAELKAQHAYIQGRDKFLDAKDERDAELSAEQSAKVNELREVMEQKLKDLGI